ncbi:Ig-like domain-containing protein [Angustibacter luteus]
MTAASGASIEGELSADKSVWTATGGLKPKTTYTVTAKAENADGASTSTTSTLRTLTPKDTANYTVIPSSGVVGVGMPVVIQFVSPVDKDKRADIEKRVTVSATPAVKGTWGWLDGRQLIFRPSKYWKSGSKVHVTADVAGIETKKDLWTATNADTTFTVGSAMISTVNTQTHRMTVTQNGKVLRTLKVSTGRPGSKTETRSGIKVILSRESEHTMDSTTVGIPKGQPGYYRLKTEWAMRLTWSGEFLHSAPWSVGSQGSANVSHGCTNLSPSDAKWLFDHSKMGDVVKFVGSSRGLEEYNGYTMWNQTAAQWGQKSALAS